MNNVLLTGVAGFIGHKTAQFLLEKGHHVIGIDNLNDYYDVRLKQHRLEQLTGIAGFEFHEIDIEDKDRLKSLCQTNSIDVIMNLAARAGVPYSLENPKVYVSTNLQGSLNLLEVAKDYSIGKYVLASTSSLYAGEEMPFCEDLAVNSPISPYAASKKGAELMAYTYHHIYGIDVTVLRYFTVFGPAGRPDMSIFRFIKWIDEGTPLKLYGDGSQSRDFTYLDDIAEGTVKAIKKVGYEVINLGGGRNPLSLNDVIGSIEEKLGKKALIDHEAFQKTDMKETWADISKAKRLLDWTPQIDFEEGLDRTVDWYRENRSWLQEVAV
jgi:nucleoside-diphosphate-sugar epimerase|tara:strand:+ start:429 stop:1400 length:972 start_codon:yes stop_codon:yes gene_type:complete